MSCNIPLFKTDSNQADIDAVAAVIRRGTSWAVGPEVQEFESAVNSVVGSKYCVSFNSGTSALHALIEAHGLSGTDVIVPSFTFIATANSVVLGGANPVFAESEGETFGLDASDVESRITSRTSAMVILHYGGCPSRDTLLLEKIAESKGLILIEDAAESLGSQIGERRVGSFGKSGMFSFCQNKVVSSGEGGVAVTNDEEIFERVKLTRSHGRFEDVPGDYFTKTGESDYVSMGYNFRMSSITAALGNSQLSRLRENIAKRQLVASYYNTFLGEVAGVQFVVTPKNFANVYQMYTITVATRKIRDGLQAYLLQNGVMTKVYFQPIHLTRYYSSRFKYSAGMLPRTEALSERVLTLPFFPNMERQEVERVVGYIDGYMRGTSL